jgi:opine dehydrogenase
MITPPALHHRAFVESLFPHLEPGQFVLFNTGYWGSLRFADDLKAAGRFDDVTLCETNIMPYLSKRMDSTATKIYNAKRVMTLAAFPGERTGDAFELFRDAYEEYKSVPNVMWTNLSSGGNWCIHVQLTLPIMGYVFDRFRGCKFYTEATEQFSRLSAAFDRERSPLVDRFGCGPVETGPQWAKNAYGYEGKDLADAFRKSPHADRFSPVAALDRVLDEDIAYSFVPMTRLARAVGLEMPTTEGMVHVTGAMLQKDYWEMGLSLDDLGLVGLDAPTMMKFVDTGRT